MENFVNFNFSENSADLDLAMQLDDIVDFVTSHPEGSDMAPPSSVDFLELAASSAGLKDFGVDATGPSPLVPVTITLDVASEDLPFVLSQDGAAPSPYYAATSPVPSPSDSLSLGYDSLASPYGSLTSEYDSATSPLPSPATLSPMAASSSGGGRPQRRRRRQEPKTKLYERDQPFEDAERERRRVNAINAKRHRDMKKAEEDRLRQEVETLRRENRLLKEQLKEALRQPKTLNEQPSLFGELSFDFDFGI